VGATSVRVDSRCGEHAFVGIFREKVILGFLFAQRLEPDAVILAFLSIFPA
jgi:hypothetical protein